MKPARAGDARSWSCPACSWSRPAPVGAEADVSDVAILADVAPSTAGRLVDTAEDAGLLGRLPSVHSGRRTALALTGAGAALRQRAVEARTGRLADRFAAWDAADVVQFKAILQRFAGGVHDDG